MKKFLALVLLTPFVFGTEDPLWFKFYKKGLMESKEYFALQSGLIRQNKFFKLSPDEGDEIAAAVRCNGKVFAGKYKFVDFLIYKSSIGNYKYLQLVTTNKKRDTGVVYPLMAFAKEINGNLFFHNIIDFYGMYSSFDGGAQFLSKPELINMGLEMSQEYQILVNSVDLSAHIRARLSLMEVIDSTYKGKNCKMIDTNNLDEDLEYFYKRNNQDDREELIESLKQF